MFTDSPSFTCNRRYEVREDHKIQTMCEPKGIPQPVITWIKDGQEMETLHRWTKHDSGNYSLLATNTHGTASHVLYLDVLCKFYCSELQSLYVVFCLTVSDMELNFFFFPKHIISPQTPLCSRWEITPRR